MIRLLRRRWLWFLLFGVAGLALRLFFIHKFAQANGDALIYGDIALNWMRHGVYGLTELGEVRPTLIRLPGYTMFLVACFKLFGAEHYHAVMYVQTAFDLGTAWVLAAIGLRATANTEGTEYARRPRRGAGKGQEQTQEQTQRQRQGQRQEQKQGQRQGQKQGQRQGQKQGQKQPQIYTDGHGLGAGERVALAAFAVYCLFPYTAVYVASALTETLTLFFLSLAIYFFIRGLQEGRSARWVACGAACAAAVILRPDGGLVLIALGVYLVWQWKVRNTEATKYGSRAKATTEDTEDTRRKEGEKQGQGQEQGQPQIYTDEHGSRAKANRSGLWGRLLRPLLIIGVVALLPLAPWAVRNWRTFHMVQPLAPANATDPGEAYDPGFVRWTHTWMLDFVSVYEIGWNVPGEAFDAGLLPSRAFDSAEQRQRTLDLIAQYNDKQTLTAELDAEFGELAATRVRAHPWRNRVVLPVGRVLDMWLRPRTEQFPIEARWWEFDAHEGETVFAVAYAVLGIVFLVLAVVGWWRGRLEFAGVLVSYVVLRTLFLLTVGTAEPRYTIECWPMVLLLAAVALAGRSGEGQGQPRINTDERG